MSLNQTPTYIFTLANYLKISWVLNGIEVSTVAFLAVDQQQQKLQVSSRVWKETERIRQKNWTLMPPRDELQGTFCLFPRAVPPTSWCLRVCFQTLHGYFFVPGCYPGDREMLTFSAFCKLCLIGSGEVEVKPTLCAMITVTLYKFTECL